MHAYVVTAIVVLLSMASLITLSVSGFREGRKVRRIVDAIAFLFICSVLRHFGIAWEFFSVSWRDSAPIVLYCSPHFWVCTDIRYSRKDRSLKNKMVDPAGFEPATSAV